MATYDVIIIGAGAAGSAAMWQLAERGVRVLTLDRFAKAHDRGSSHGQTRAIRQAYFEHPDYVPLLRRAYELWDQLAAKCGQELFVRCGMLEVGPADGEVIPGVLRSVAAHGLAIDQPTPREARAAFPGLHISDEDHIVIERDAGYLLVEEAVMAQLQAGMDAGGIWRREAVVGWQVDGDGVRVDGESARYRGDRLIIAAGAWTSSLLSSLNLPLRVILKHQFWLQGDRPELDRHLPVFFFEEPEGMFYGFPALDARGLKVAEHSGGKTLGQTVDDPSTVDRAVDEGQWARIAAFAERRLPTQARQRIGHSTCFYTTTPDQHFIVARHPQYRHVCFAAGLSGHGFKFAPVLGEALADLSQHGKTELDIGFLDVGRPGVL